MSLLIIGLLIMVPAVESSFIGDTWDAITGFFTLITGMAIVPTECSSHGGTCLVDCTGPYYPFISNGETVYYSCVEDVMNQGPPLEGNVVREITGNVVEGAACCQLNECGDTIVWDGEECDKQNLDGASCGSLGFDGGTLACNTLGGCVFDTSGCYYGVDCSEVSCQDNWLDCQGEYTTDCSETIPGSSPTCGEFGDCSGDPAENLCEDGVTPCTTCDCNQCPLNLACVSDPSVDTPTESPSGNSGSSSQTTCASVSGTCTDFCDAGYVAYNENLLDLTCNQVYDTSVPLICCASEDAQLSPRGTTSGDEDDTTSGGGSPSRNLRDALTSPSESSSRSFVPEDATGLQKLFSNLSYGMGGIWTIFTLVVIIVGTTYFLHRRFHRK